MSEKEKIKTSPEKSGQLEELVAEISCYNDAMRLATDDFQDNLSGVYVNFFTTNIEEKLTQIRENF